MRRMHNRLFGLVAAGLLTSALAMTQAIPAQAQGKAAAADAEADPKAQAKLAYGEAQEKFKAGDFAGALPLYQKADSFYPGAAPKYKIAVCHDKLGQATEAVAGYRAFIASNPSEKYTDRLAEANKRITELEASMPATVTLTVAPANVPGLQITVDGNPAQGPAIMLQPGEHTIIITAPGYDPATEVVSVRGNEKRAVAVTLMPTAALPPPPPPPPPPGGEQGGDEEGRSNVPAYVTLGIAGAGAILGTVFGIQAIGAKSDFDDDPTVDNADKAERAALIADMSFGVALTFGITGAVLLFSSDDGGDAAAEEAGAVPTLTPYAGTKGGGLGATWSF